MKRVRPLLAVLALFLLLPAAAAAWNVGAGWTRSDVGLDQDGDGLWFGAGNRTPLTPLLDLSWSVDYVQKRGIQPTAFSSPDDPITVADAKVNLHYLQPTVYLGAGLGDLPLRPRLYVGGSYALKMSEAWSDFPGTPATELAYEDSDFVGQVGLTLGLGPVDLDARYMRGFASSLIVDTTFRGGAKAETDLPGVDDPRIGAKLETFTLGALYTF
jgi:hypothetical protein